MSLTPPPLEWRLENAERREQTARTLAERASTRRFPLKSLATYGAAARRQGIRPALVEAVVGRAVEILQAEYTRSSASGTEGNWFSIAQAARMLAVPVSWIRDHLETPEGRRVLGYPAFFAGRWRIPSAACLPDHRARYLAELPAQEPPENIRDLPR